MTRVKSMCWIAVFRQGVSCLKVCFDCQALNTVGGNRGSGRLQKATPKSRATAARLDMRAPRLACAPLAYAGLLAALTSARRDEDQSTHLQPALDTRPRRPAHAPERRFSVAELEEGQRSAGATIQYVGDVPSRSTATPKLRYSDESSVIGHSLSEPTMKRVRANVQRCGFTWDDAAAKCGRPCPYGLASECNEKAAPLPPNSSWINSTYSCYVSGHHSNMHTHVHMHTHTCTRDPTHVPRFEPSYPPTDQQTG